MNRIVARFQDGRVLKGTTFDFQPGGPIFHLRQENQAPGSAPVVVRVRDLKALFFVKSFEGDSRRAKTNEAPAGGPGAGRRVRIVFKDGEIMVGTTVGYDRSRPGFFVVPVDPESNNERCYVVTAATQEVSFL